MQTKSVSVQNERALSSKARKAIWGAFIGFFVDMFDVYLPAVVLGPAMIYFQPKNLSPSLSAILGALVFAVTLVGRPLGALLFGRFGDKYGRKRVAMTSVAGFGVVTLLMALLPGYEQWGLTALIILIVLRLVDGIFLGGEYTAASPLAMEYCPKEKRGFYGALIMGGFPLAYVCINLVTMFMLKIAPAGDVHSPYVTWGWRVPFFIGALIAFAFVAYYHFFVDESELWEQANKTNAPIRTLFSGENLRSFIQVFVLMTGLWITLQMVAAVLPGLLRNVVKLSNIDVTRTLLVGNIVLFFGYLAAGVLSQRIGRRRTFAYFAILCGILGTYFYYMLLGTPANQFGMILFLAALVELFVVSIWGVVTTYINERFHTNVRASGFGLGYSLAVIIPSFYAFYQAALESVVPAKYTELVLLVIGSIFMLIGALMGPETKDIDFEKELGS